MCVTILWDEEISEAVMRLWLHRASGPSEIKAEHLRMWHRAAMREEKTNPGNWEKVSAIIQAAFGGLYLTAPCAWQTVVMISMW